MYKFGVLGSDNAGVIVRVTSISPAWTTTAQLCAGTQFHGSRSSTLGCFLYSPV